MVNIKKRALDTDAPNQAKKARLRIDDLAWKEVAMPDRLDDVEGFFGLEEIDGVDIMAGESGMLEFKVGLGNGLEGLAQAGALTRSR